LTCCRLSGPAFCERGHFGFQRLGVEGVRVVILSCPLAHFGVEFVVRVFEGCFDHFGVALRALSE
jgi:hypothetical protein